MSSEFVDDAPAEVLGLALRAHSSKWSEEMRVAEEEHVAYSVTDLYARGDIPIRQVMAGPNTRLGIDGQGANMPNRLLIHVQTRDGFTRNGQ